jgi:hypothetical protein
MDLFGHEAVRSRRVVKLQRWVLELLRKLKGGAGEGGAACDSIFSELIFTTTRGEPINEEYLVRKHFKPLYEKLVCRTSDSTISATHLPLLP